MRWLVLGLVVWFALARPASAEFLVEQEVAVAMDGITQNVAVHWLVGTRGFRVVVSGKDREQKTYVFNGRVFYICGQLSKQSIDVLKAAKFSDDKVLASLQNGACQEASTDFVVKFFLSPHMAIFEDTASSGMKTNLAISGMKISLDGEANTHAGTSCVGMNRQLEISELIAMTKTTLIVDECHAPTIKWRAALAMELRKKLMMQSSGRTYQKLIQEDAKSRKGLTLSGRVSFGSRLSATIKTIKVQPQSVSVAQLKIPDRFKIVDLKTEAMKAKIPSGSKRAKQKLVPASALIQLLLLGGNPASAFINATGEE